MTADPSNSLCLWPSEARRTRRSAQSDNEGGRPVGCLQFCLACRIRYITAFRHSPVCGTDEITALVVSAGPSIGPQLNVWRKRGQRSRLKYGRLPLDVGGRGQVPHVSRTTCTMFSRGSAPMCDAAGCRGDVQRLGAGLLDAPPGNTTNDNEKGTALKVEVRPCPFAPDRCESLNNIHSTHRPGRLVRP
ncbi:hypothetical protein P154DRAFT_180951 [Amniculicola lignicola CBS 123094]|uniref:Uncharacterized protein n=1 Tax=Amniculicola lignicola CBS 123094 TaxID=1392246 RepID=A0A6A5X0T8_9PLEO|nr:hypothetical protein P154DRAFT_180951 [Amniculicola lignicola CBS 123094]